MQWVAYSSIPFQIHPWQFIMILKQDTRTLKLTTPLGDNELLLTAFRGHEEISRLFHFELEMISDNNAITPADIIGKNVTFSVALTDDSPRFFNGFVSKFVAEDEDGEGRRNYRAEVVPWLWFLTRTSDCRIFQEKSVPQIVEQIFGDLGFTDFKIQLSGNHPTRTYCVQYRETDFNFVCRLLEEEGIFYFFTHEDGKHQMVIGDRPTTFQNCPEAEVDYPSDFGRVAFEDHLTSWSHRYRFATGKYAQTDYNFETPSASLMTNTNTLVNLQGNDKYEVYDFPGIYANTGDGQPLTDIRMEEQEVEYDVVDATSKCKTFTPGGKFKVRQHRCSTEEGNSFVITAIDHQAAEPLGYETGGSVDTDYSNSFTCIPDSVSFRPARLTPKPFVQGVQTAVVVGPAGEEIYVDEFGRVKVQFHWDREGKKDENTSCWMRVSQSHAGPSFGSIIIPRMGEEVIVSFMEGDPDRPIITGRVYHAENMPPFGLPDAKVISGMKSKTYKGEGYNEYVMDDTPGNELIREHGQFDKDSTIQNDLREHVLNNRSRDVTVDETVQVGNNRTMSVGVDHSETVGSNQTVSIGSNQNISVGMNLTETVGINYSETVGAAMELTVGAVMTHSVGAAYTISVGAVMSTTVGANKKTSIGGNRGEQVSGKVTEKVGGNVAQQYGGKHTEKVSSDYKLKSGSKITLEAASKITLKTGSSSIEMTSGGNITIKGTKIKIEGTAKIEEKAAQISSKASAKNEMKGAMVDVKASAINTIKGALVKIN